MCVCVCVCVTERERERERDREAAPAGVNARDFEGSSRVDLLPRQAGDACGVAI